MRRTYVGTSSVHLMAAKIRLLGRMTSAAAFHLEQTAVPRVLTTFGGGDAPIDYKEIQKKLHNDNELEELRAQLVQDRAEQAEMVALIGQSAPDELDAEWLTQRAHALWEKEKEFVETLPPVIRALKNLIGPDRELQPEVARLVQDAVEILEAYPPLYRDLSNALLKQADERRGAGPKVLRARPVKGEIDFAELSREHIARYPKIRARLAE